MECSICHKATGKEDLLPNSRDLLVLKRSERTMWELARTVLLVERHQRRKLGLPKIPKSLLMQIIKWSVGVNISRPIKERRFKYACGHLFHDHCDAVQRNRTHAKKGICPICNIPNATRALTSIVVRATLRFF